MIYAQASEHGLRPSELSAHDGMEIACDYYEGLITKGVLRVVKKVKVRMKCYEDGVFYSLNTCECGKEWADDREDNDGTDTSSFCPGCGNEIQKPQ